MFDSRDDREFTTMAKELFGSHELEGPSERVDRAVMEAAEARDGIVAAKDTIGARRRAIGVAIAVAVAAVLALAVTALWITTPSLPGSSDTTSVALLGEADLESAVSTLRTEIEQIDEMAEIIVEDDSATRDEISERVRACLAKIQELEQAIAIDDSTQSSAVFPETLHQEERA